MNADNPYEPPEKGAPADPHDAMSDADNPPLTDTSPAVSTHNTVLPRHIAAILDNAIAMVLGVMAAKSVSDDPPVMQLLAAVAAYLGYYLLSEGLISRTPGKLVTGLVVIGLNGARCTWRQSVIRTCFRVLEVNPALLGAIPAAISILFSRHHQRIGDKVARTIVVPSRRARRIR